MERKDKNVLDQNINQKRIKATNFINLRTKKYRKKGWRKKILSHIKWLLSFAQSTKFIFGSSYGEHLKRHWRTAGNFHCMLAQILLRNSKSYLLTVQSTLS